MDFREILQRELFFLQPVEEMQVLLKLD